MLTRTLDYLVSAFSPIRGLRRQHARQVMRRYSGAESNRLTANKKPKNQAADSELYGPFGADAMRAWARMLVRDNAWAWSALESIVSEVIGTGIGVESALEDDAGADQPDTNEARDKTWREWAEVSELTGQYTFDELQSLAFREMVEAGECLIHMVKVPLHYKGIQRPVPLALELIEADRLANDHDTYAHIRKEGKRIVRGVELDELGKPVAYWVYPQHPTDPFTFYRGEPVRIEAANILHLYRRDRIGQSRGVSWFAPVVNWMRDLGEYVNNELQASAVASCFTVAIKSDGGSIGGLAPPSTTDDTTDDAGNTYEYLEPGMIMRLNTNESIESANPGRPNSNAGPWIELMLRGIAAGTGTSYESVSKDFSNTSYSSSRTSKLENRPRYRRWQRYWMAHLCQPVWDRFCEAAAIAGRQEFPTMAELLEDRRAASPVEFLPPEWEWVDVKAEQESSEAAINAHQSTLQAEVGRKGGNWRRVLKQASREKREKERLGLVSPVEAEAKQQLADAESKLATAGEEKTGTGELMGLSRLQWKRNRKAIEDVLGELANGAISEAKASVFLSGIGMSPENVQALIEDARDGQVDSLPEDKDAQSQVMEV